MKWSVQQSPRPRPNPPSQPTREKTRAAEGQIVSLQMAKAGSSQLADAMRERQLVRFSRRFEAEYERRVAAYRARGLEAVTAHGLALEETEGR